MARLLTPLPPHLRLRPFTSGEALAAGLRYDTLALQNATPVFRGIYIPPCLPDTSAVRAWAALISIGEGGILAHWSACLALGMDSPPPGEPAHVRVLDRHATGTRPGLALHRPRAPRLHATWGALKIPISTELGIALVDGDPDYPLPPGVRVKRAAGLSSDCRQLLVRVPVEHPFDAWVSVCRELDDDRAVEVGDRLVGRKGAVATLDQIGKWLLLANRNRPGLARATANAHRLRAGTESIPETRLRLTLCAEGFDCPEVNHELVTSTGERFYLDMAYPPYRVAPEYDGDHHRARSQFRLDRVRESKLHREDWHRLGATAMTFTTGRTAYLTELAHVLASRGARLSHKAQRLLQVAPLIA